MLKLTVTLFVMIVMMILVIKLYYKSH